MSPQIPGGIGFPRPDGGPAPKTDRPLLAGDRVRFVGEPVALIIAATRAAGLEAAEAIAVDYTALPVVTEPAAAHAHRRARGLGRRARQYRLPVATRRRRRHRCRAGRIGPCNDPGIHRLARHRQFHGAAWRLGRIAADGRIELHALPPIAVRPAQRDGRRQFSDPADRYPRASGRCRRLLRDEIRRAPGIRAGRLGRPPAEPSGALDRRPDRGLSDRRTGPRNACHRRRSVWMRTENSPR